MDRQLIAERASPKQLEYWDAIQKHNSVTKAAKALKVNRRTVQRGMELLAKKLASAGYQPERGLSHPTASGFTTKRVSTLYDLDGNIKTQWHIQEPEKEAAYQAALEAIEGFVWKPAPIIPKPTTTNSQLLTLITLTDFHLGMYAWQDETGDDWDMDIAVKVALGAVQRMIDGSPASGLGILNLQGDFLHYDLLDAVTTSSGHQLDRDSRTGKMVEVAIKVIMSAVELMLKHFGKVKVLMVEGNHDLIGSLWLRKAMKVIYSKNARVEIDDTEFPYYAHLHGEIMLGFHHGHKKKNTALPALFASEPRYRSMWGQAKYCYIHTGHYHHTEQDMAEGGGAIVERHPTLASRDAYSARGGYVSWRAAHAITYHNQSGEYLRVTVTPQEVLK